jgi:hypothetical protein
MGLREFLISYTFAEQGEISMQAALPWIILLRRLGLMILLPGSLFLPGVLFEARKDDPATGPPEGQECNQPSGSTPWKIRALNARSG